MLGFVVLAYPSAHFQCRSKLTYKMNSHGCAAKVEGLAAKADRHRGIVPVGLVNFSTTPQLYSSNLTPLEHKQIIEGSLEVKLPTIRTDEKRSQEETRTWRKSEGRR